MSGLTAQLCEDAHLSNFGVFGTQSASSSSTSTISTKPSLGLRRQADGGAAQYAQFCGATLARAYAHWGDRIAIASYLGQGDMFDRAIAEFSAANADQNERDYRAFAEAVNSGRLIAQTGV